MSDINNGSQEFETKIKQESLNQSDSVYDTSVTKALERDEIQKYQKQDLNTIPANSYSNKSSVEKTKNNIGFKNVVNSQNGESKSDSLFNNRILTPKKIIPSIIKNNKTTNNLASAPPTLLFGNNTLLTTKSNVLPPLILQNQNQNQQSQPSQKSAVETLQEKLNDLLSQREQLDKYISSLQDSIAYLNQKTPNENKISIQNNAEPEQNKNIANNMLMQEQLKTLLMDLNQQQQQQQQQHFTFKNVPTKIESISAFDSSGATQQSQQQQLIQKEQIYNLTPTKKSQFAQNQNSFSQKDVKEKDKITPSNIDTQPLNAQGGCNCKRTKCLKLYCECFQNMVACTANCGCHDCQNNPLFEHERSLAIEQIMNRDQEAFNSKYKKDMSSGSTLHKRGCNCKKSNCLKKYCECFHAGIQCTNQCLCDDCKNISAEQMQNKKKHEDMYNIFCQQQQINFDNNANAVVGSSNEILNKTTSAISPAVRKQIKSLNSFNTFQQTSINYQQFKNKVNDAELYQQFKNQNQDQFKLINSDKNGSQSEENERHVNNNDVSSVKIEENKMTDLNNDQ